ncbi:MAG: NnrS family protein [Oceanicoccus sp.]
MTPLFQTPFRPFFLASTIYACVIIALWAYFWVSPFSWAPYGGVVWWHGHEMLFGFVAAIVVGFLLTAVRNWTGVTAASGRSLVGLFTTWVIGRLLIIMGGDLSPILVFFGDQLFLILSAVAVTLPVLKVKQWRNLIFLPILLTLAVLNGVSHYSILNNNGDQAMTALHATIIVFILIVAIMGGRVIPLFTANKMGLKTLPAIKWLEFLCLSLIVLLVPIAFVGFDHVPGEFLAGICFLAAFAHCWRLSRWGGARCVHIPLLWSLHLSYCFIPIGLVVLALNSLNYVESYSPALHLWTVGTISSMILAMIARVTLGHTGRALIVPKSLGFAFALILIAALVRGFIPILFPQWSVWGIVAASAGWLVAYGIFIVYFSPMLVSARIDGRPG